MRAFSLCFCLIKYWKWTLFFHFSCPSFHFGHTAIVHWTKNNYYFIYCTLFSDFVWFLFVWFKSFLRLFRNIFKTNCRHAITLVPLSHTYFVTFSSTYIIFEQVLKVAEYNLCKSFGCLIGLKSLKNAIISCCCHKTIQKSICKLYLQTISVRCFVAYGE